jgi:cytochrome c oxidase subunit 2
MSDHTPHGVGAATAEALEPDLHIDKWEGIWIRISFALVTFFTICVIIAAFAFNIQLPGVTGRIDPNNLKAEGSPFATTGLRELAPGKYEAYMIARIWYFEGAPITVPVDSEVTFYVTSADIQHGFKVAGTNINMMSLPGQVSKLRAVFDKPGEYPIYCHEYCGTGHHTMYGTITVTARAEEEVPAEESAASGANWLVSLLGFAAR